MNILFPNNPLEPGEVDPDFADQAAAAEVDGFPRHLVGFESLVQEAAPVRAARRVPERSGPCLYRGWMLKPPAYTALAGALEARGAPLVVSPEAYAYAHHLPGWYDDFQLVTAATTWTSSAAIDEVRAALARLPPSRGPRVDARGPHRLTGTVDYQVAAIARDVLDAAQHGTEHLPDSMLDFVRDPAAVGDLLLHTAGASGDACYNAWRWLGQRSISALYFRAYPLVWFVRLDDHVCVRWDNRDRLVDGIPVWTATRGEFALPVDAFVRECTDFKDRLPRAMEGRIDGIDSGDAPATIPLDLPSLRQQHETWRNEFAGDLRPLGPDVP